MTIMMKIGKKMPMFIKKRFGQTFLKGYVKKLKKQKKRFVRVKIDNIRYDLDLYTYVGCTFYNLRKYEPKTMNVIKRILK